MKAVELAAMTFAAIIIACLATCLIEAGKRVQLLHDSEVMAAQTRATMRLTTPEPPPLVVAPEKPTRRVKAIKIVYDDGTESVLEVKGE